MSDKVIRLGGGHIGLTASTTNLKQYLSGTKGRNLVVVSAISELIELFNRELSLVFIANTEEDEFTKRLSLVFKKYHVGEISEAYHNLAVQAGSLLKGIALIGDYSRALKDQVISYSEKLIT